jgi:hypothetical protein
VVSDRHDPDGFEQEVDGMDVLREAETRTSERQNYFEEESAMKESEVKRKSDRMMMQKKTVKGAGAAILLT